MSVQNHLPILVACRYLAVRGPIIATGTQESKKRTGSSVSLADILPTLDRLHCADADIKPTIADTADRGPIVYQKACVCWVQIVIDDALISLRIYENKNTHQSHHNYFSPT